MGVLNHWGGAGNGGTAGDWGIYCPPPEHGRIIKFYSYYHGLVFGGEVEARNAPIQAMVGAVRLGYPGDKGGSCSSRGGGGRYGDIIIRGRGRVW